VSATRFLGLILVALSALRAVADEPATRPAPVPAQARALSLAPGDLRALRHHIDELLRDELTRLWYPRAVDPAGGFHQNFARDWSARPDDERSVVYQARMTWTAAAFAEFSPAHRAAFEGYARHGVAYLDTVIRDREQGGFHWAVGPDGKVSARIGTEKHIYGTSFVIYSASKAYEVTKDPRALAVARDAFAWLERHAHDAQRGGYFEALTRDGTPILERDDRLPPGRRTDRLGVYYGFKSMNSHIHLLEAVAALSRVDKSGLVKERLRELLGVVRDKVGVDPGALNLYLTPDWQATPAHDSFGHDVETAYLLVEAAEALGIPEDPATWRRARMLIDHALDWGWDDELGGFYDKGEVFAGPAFDRTKVWWTQAEGLNALLLMHRRFRGETDRYGKAFLKQWQFIEAHQIDPVHGGWFGETTREGKMLGNGDKANAWKVNYHTSRALMNVSRMLGELAGE
jgi:mannobiose 2-epimerase